MSYQDETQHVVDQRDSNGRDLLVAGVIVFVVTVAALVALTLAGHDATSLLTLAGPVVAALLITGHVNRVTGQQNRQLQRTAAGVEQVRRQTNGVLDERIKRQTTAAITETLQDVGLIPPAGRVRVDLATTDRPATDAGEEGRTP